MGKSKSKFNRNLPKKGFRKPMSIKKKLKKAREVLCQKKRTQIEHENLNPVGANRKSYRQKNFPGFFLNRLFIYQNKVKKRHFANVEEIVPLKPETENSQSVLGLLIFSFLISDEYLIALKNQRFRKVLVSHSLSRTTEFQSEFANENTLLIHPPNYFGENTESAFHPKLILIERFDSLEIIIGTGNLLDCDWEKYGNAFFKKTCRKIKHNCGQSSSFLNELNYFINFCVGPYSELAKKIHGIDLLNFSWDWPEIGLVFSIPGKISQSTEFTSSFYQLENLMKNNPPESAITSKNFQAHYVTSSLGLLTERLIQDFSSSFYSMSLKAETEVLDTQDLIKNRFRVIFPTAEYIRSTALGHDSSKGVFLNSSIWDSFRFVKSVLMTYQGNRFVNGTDSITPHYKFFVVKNCDQINDDSVVYLGSHNFTSAAWGRKSFAEKTLEGFNYELGIIFLPWKGTAAAKNHLIERLGIELNAPMYLPKDQPHLS